MCTSKPKAPTNQVLSAIPDPNTIPKPPSIYAGVNNTVQVGTNPPAVSSNVQSVNKTTSQNPSFVKPGVFNPAEWSFDSATGLYKPQVGMLKSAKNFNAQGLTKAEYDSLNGTQNNTSPQTTTVAAAPNNTAATSLGVAGANNSGGVSGGGSSGGGGGGNKQKYIMYPQEQSKPVQQAMFRERLRIMRRAANNSTLTNTNGTIGLNKSPKLATKTLLGA